MEFTVVVLYNGALTHYTVTEGENGCYEACLLKYNGDRQSGPPNQMWFTKEGRHCVGDIEDQDLMDEIYHAVLEQKERGGVLSPEKSPKVPYVHI